MVGILVEVVQPIIVLFEVPAAVSLHLLLQDLAVLAVVVARFFVCVVVLVVGADRSQRQPASPHQRILRLTSPLHSPLDTSSTSSGPGT